jgi:hypothetical protein
VPGRLVELVGALVALPARDARHHDVRPRLSSRTSDVKTT